jgi:hypothetical protein
MRIFVVRREELIRGGEHYFKFPFLQTLGSREMK